MDKVIFLDRDGTINEEVEYLHRQSDLHFLPGAVEGLALLKQWGFKLVVVTNQAGVARGYYKEEDVDLLHRYMNEQLEAHKAGIDCFFYCPHHPVHGIGAYKQECHCRKPETGMFEMAEACYSIDKAHSYMIGDKFLDTEAGRRYGVTSVLVGTGYGTELKAGIKTGCENDYYDYFAKDLADAARWIIQREGEQGR